MPRFAPRYPQRLYEMIEELDDERLTLAAVTRQISDAAQAAGMTRPSPVHVRRLLAELRRLREDEREIRRTGWEAATRAMPYAPPNVYEVEAAMLQARERTERRARRRTT